MRDWWRTLLVTSIPMVRDVVSRDDCEIVLATRYHLRLSVKDRTFLRRIEDDFIAALHAAASGDGELQIVGRAFFQGCLAHAEALAERIIILDDIYPAPVAWRRFYSVNRVFDFERFPERLVLFRSAGIADTAEGSAPALSQGEHVWIYDDGIFSGSTIYAAVEQLTERGVYVDGVFAALGKVSAIEALSRRWKFKRPVVILGLQFVTGWDHCRDLIGVDGLRNELAGYVPYWNIPEWISLARVPSAVVASIGRDVFSEVERYLAERHNVHFKRRGRNLVPTRRTSKTLQARR
jgi:hypothetical protein